MLLKKNTFVELCNVMYFGWLVCITFQKYDFNNKTNKVYCWYYTILMYNIKLVA